MTDRPTADDLRAKLAEIDARDAYDTRDVGEAFLKDSVIDWRNEVAELLAAAWPAPVVDQERVADWFRAEDGRRRTFDSMTGLFQQRADDLIAAMSWRTEAEVKAEALREAREAFGHMWQNDTLSAGQVYQALNVRADQIGGTQ